MMDRQISATEGGAWLLWIMASAVVMLDLFLESNDVGHIGLAMAAGAATLHVRSWFCRLECRLEAMIRTIGREDVQRLR